MKSTWSIKRAKIKRLPKKTMIFRQSIANAECEGEKFDISVSISNGNPVWYFSGEGRYYAVSIRELTEDVMAFRESLGVRKGVKK